MNQFLRVLVVEDSENDAVLIVRELRRGGYDTKFERVGSAAAMEAALERQEWDLIISDYVMPGFSGLEALAIFKRKELDVPFLIVSGHIGEDIAVGAMKAGAHDYIMKDKMARLVPTVARELREAAMRQSRKRSARALRESEERFRQLAENIDAVFFMFDRSDGNGPDKILYVSPAYESIWGRSRESLYRDSGSWLKAVHAEDAAKVLERLPSLERGQFDFEFRIVSLDRKVRWIHYRTFPVFNEEGEAYRVAGIAQDVTRHRQAEEQLEDNARKLENMVEELKAIEEELRASNQAISESRRQLEQRVQERTADLAVANAELQCQMHERTRLERELLEIAEKERRRIGYDLHDDLSQKLTGVSFMIKALERKVASKHLPKVLETRKIQDLIDQVINHTHDLAHNFSALDLQGDDLALELKSLASNVRKMFQISCQFSSKGTLPSLQQNVTAQLYKIAQEAASNAIKHGQAKRVSIFIQSPPEQLALTIMNDGLPFPENERVKKGMGLRIMNSRASMIGARLEIRSNGGNGTAVTCTLPLASSAKITQVDFDAPRQRFKLANGNAPAAATCGTLVGMEQN